MLHFKHLNIRIIKNTVDEKSSILSALRDIEVICNCLSYELLHNGKTIECYKEILNTEYLIKTGTFNNLAKFIHLSSTLIYELESLNNIDESYKPIIKNELQYLALYWEKVVTNLCEKNNIVSIILRPANPIGPGDRSSFFTRLLTSHAKNAYPIVKTGSAKISLIDVRDIGKAIEWFTNKNFIDRGMFLLKGFDSSWIEIKQHIDLCLGKKSNEIYLSDRLNKEELNKYGLTPFSAKIFNIDRVWDDTKIRRLGFKPTFSLTEAIRSYIEFSKMLTE